MPFIRPVAFLSLARRAPLVRQPFTSRTFISTPARFATQGYGDGEGDPKGENPQHQGSSNSTKHNAEHPGPAPPAEGQNSGSGPTKGKSSSTSGGKAPEDASATSGGSRSKDAEEKGSSPTGGEVKGTPKIHDKREPGRDISAEKQAEVDQHNKEFEQRHDRAPKAQADKVDKKFWSGQGGADKDP